MVKFEEYQKLALSFPETKEEKHFEIPSFRFKNKIFATYWTKEDKAMLRLSPEDQDVFCSIDNKIFCAVDGYWGKQGATFVNLKLVKKSMFKDALRCSYEYIRQKYSKPGKANKIKA